MNYLGKFIDNFRHVYKEINAATLTGAIDVVVVEQPDGTYTCSPFHVRFGKIGVLRSREKIVEIEINGEPCDIYMKLGESGEAFFVEELSLEDEALPKHLVCSPIPYSENPEQLESESAVWIPISNIKGSQESIPEIVEDTPATGLKTFHAKTVQSLSDCEIPASSDFRPIQSVSEHEGYHSSSEIEKLSQTHNKSDNNLNASNKLNKKKRRRKRKNLSSEFRVDSEKHTIVEIDGLGKNEDECDNGITQCEPNESEIGEAIVDISMQNSQNVTSLSDLHFFSDTDVPSTLHDTNQFSPAQSDTEFEVSTRPKGGDDCAITAPDDAKKGLMAHRPSWRWGELPSPIPKTDMQEIPGKSEPTKERDPEVQRSMLASMLGFMKKTKHIRNNELDGSIYLSQLDADGLDPEIARLYLSHCDCTDSYKPEDDSKEDGHDKDDEDVESGNGPSLAQSPVSDVETSADNHPSLPTELTYSKDEWDVAMSLCGGLNSENPPNYEQFNEHLITYEQFVNDPAIFKNPNLIFRINGQMYDWETACPLILSLALYRKSLPKEVVTQLQEEGSSKARNVSSVDNNRHRRGYYSWFYWARTNQTKPGTDVTQCDSKEGIETKITCQMGSSISSPLESANVTYEDITPTTPTNESDFITLPESGIENKRIRTYSSTDSELEATSDGLHQKEKPEKYRKTLRLTSKQIEGLNLQSGANEIVFSVTTAYQGTTRCKCTLFLWRHDDKIVISDIDGTITKSDVLGHIMPIVGNAWAQSGVAKLFNRIEDNGYKLLYLSARAIGQSKGTRKYLNSIRQEDLTLPDGPILLNPTSLLSAFHREVIEKKPEEFKISCLRDIQALFPSSSNPFYAGYGNKINDVWTYQAVGIPMFRIFTINHRGELRHELTNTFKSSYLSMSQIADQLFPVRSKQTLAEEFSEFNYWREPILEIEDLPLTK
ncbi:hypothetical protein V9T40_012877 [Parthenolecanium corni]|uniref:phosphatidate phosphatase n=1 Tax=Parthenolecanium corni TaxID=536013 RepID=A0AAN9TP28_9HEMI